MFGKLKIITAVLVAFSFVLCGTAAAYRVPYDNSNLKYFYVFGEDGDPLMGAEDSELELFIDVPEDEPGDVVVKIFDPDVGGKRDWRIPGNKWNTTTRFSFYGKKLLAEEKFGEDPAYDKEYYTFGPYSKTEGKKIGNFYRFRLVAKGLNGDDQNLFKVEVLPDSAESFVENITFRLLPHQGEKMYFYPEIPAGTKSIIVENYDLDVNGGTSTLSMSAISEKFDIKDSKSGQWRETGVPMAVDTEGRVVYIITKGTQRYANAGLRMKTDKGKTIPIYFRKGSPPAAKKAAPRPKPMKKPDLKCNKFTFDATSSYDIDRQDLSYLWNFGDGTTSTEPVVTHVYEKGGEYTVTLTVKDDSGLPCDTAGTSQKIYVNTPPVASLRAPGAVCVDDSVTFDASGTKDDTPGNLSYMWNFGDGSRGEGRTVTHTYSRGGNYHVTLTVDDNSGTECNLDSVKKPIKVNTAPVANAGRDISMCLKSMDDDYSVRLDGSRSKDADGDSLSYMWDLGDGNTAQGAKVTHVYKNSGSYTARLTVNDGSGLACDSDSDSVTIDLNKPPVAVAGESQKVCAGDTVVLDGTGSKTEPGETLSYKWDFGDGTSATGATQRHTYSRGGKYTVLLTVDDGRGTSCSTSSDSLYVKVNSMPQAKLEAVEDTCVGKKVRFDASDSKDPDGDRLDYMWNFGDGTKVKGSSRMSHTYEKGGQYNVSVTVDDGQGSACSTDSDAVSFRVNAPPKADIDIVKACCVDMTQKFDGSGSNDPDGDRLTYMWDLGDGTKAEGAKVSHAYSKPGTYKVVLTVNDGSKTECSIDTAIDTIEVNAKPVPVIKIR